MARMSSISTAIAIGSAKAATRVLYLIRYSSLSHARAGTDKLIEVTDT
jgi:hypothetical protein